MSLPRLFLLADRAPSLTAEEYALSLEQRLAAQLAATARKELQDKTPSER